MTPEMVTQWAREAGAEVNRLSTIFYSRADLEAFAAKVAAHAAAHEREMCARVCESFTGSYERGQEMQACAAAIRARGA